MRTHLCCRHCLPFRHCYHCQLKELIRIGNRTNVLLKKILDAVAETPPPKPKPTTLKIQTNLGDDMNLPLNDPRVASVKVLDENGDEIVDFDFSTNAPNWSVSDNAAVLIEDNTESEELNDVLMTGQSDAAGVTLSVACAGLTTSITFDVGEPDTGGGGDQTPTSLRIDVEPPLDEAPPQREKKSAEHHKGTSASRPALSLKKRR